MADLEASLLAAIHQHDVVEDSLQFARSQEADHLAVVGVIKSLEAYEMIQSEVRCRLRVPCKQGLACIHHIFVYATA